MNTRAASGKLFGREHVNKSQIFLTPAEKYFDSTFSSFWANLAQKNLFLTRFEILGLLVNTLSGNYVYSRSNRKNFPLPIQIKLSKKP